MNFLIGLRFGLASEAVGGLGPRVKNNIEKNAGLLSHTGWRLLEI